MVYRLRRADGTASPHSAGTVVAPDGSALALGAAEVDLAVLSRWTPSSTRVVTRD